MTTETITRKDGITYTRKRKAQNLDGRLNIKLHKETIEKLKEIAAFRGIKYQTMIRKILEEYANGEKV